MAFHNGGANTQIIDYADQLISGGASNEQVYDFSHDIIFATGGNTERFRISNSTITCATEFVGNQGGGTSQQVTVSTLRSIQNNDWALQHYNYEEGRLLAV